MVFEVSRNLSPKADEKKRLTLCLREEIESREIATLSPYAALSAYSKGRKNPRPKDEYRTEFQRDRDRILHSKAFRRLSHKTQVFIAPEGDHYRTRLTHTLEVMQISRSIARTLRLNEDLTEAIALGHDLGHTPFGHAGEQAICEVLESIQEGYDNVPLEYHHARQAMRFIDVLENSGKGLNLTFETRDGILGHSGTHYPRTLEGQIVRIGDRIAYINHDIDDALRARLIQEEDLPEQFCETLGHTSAQRINTLITDLVTQSEGQNRIMMTPIVKAAMDGLRAFMFENVYLPDRSSPEEPRAKHVIESLFFHYLKHFDEVPKENFVMADHNKVQAVIDYISGMTDRFALAEFERIFVPQGWRAD
ncbi:MAG: deoxyguanosinetriphosphate triphosphohydrolase [Coriobacteriia bacterium]|nr:deoxyguanosinetriphosphate triphosphohydrolase [Coriobacteriia bacterium]